MPHLPVARRERGPVLDRESYDRCAGCPGCGVIAQGHGRVLVEVIDAPLGRGPRADPVAQYGAGYAANAPARR